MADRVVSLRPDKSVDVRLKRTSPSFMSTPPEGAPRSAPDQHKNIVVYDVGCPPNWKVVRHLMSVAYLRQQGFKAWHYRAMRD